MSRLDDLISDLCPDGVEYRKLGDIAEIGTGSSNRNEESIDGKYPFYVRSQKILRKDSYEFDETAIITAKDGDVGKIIHYINGKYALHKNAYRIHLIDETINPKFLYYYMKVTFREYVKKHVVCAAVSSIHQSALKKYPVPVVSLDEQNRIVSILDRFNALCNDLTAGLPAEIEARRKQYEYYRDRLLTFKQKEVTT